MYKAFIPFLSSTDSTILFYIARHSCRKESGVSLGHLILVVDIQSVKYLFQGDRDDQLFSHTIRQILVWQPFINQLAHLRFIKGVC